MIEFLPLNWYHRISVLLGVAWEISALGISTLGLGRTQGESFAIGTALGLADLGMALSSLPLLHEV